MKMKAEIGGVQLQAKDCWQHQKLERGLGHLLPRSPQKEQPCRHLDLGLPTSITVRG